MKIFTGNGGGSSDINVDGINGGEIYEEEEVGVNTTVRDYLEAAEYEYEEGGEQQQQVIEGEADETGQQEKRSKSGQLLPSQFQSGKHASITLRGLVAVVATAAAGTLLFVQGPTTTTAALTASVYSSSGISSSSIVSGTSLLHHRSLLFRLDEENKLEKEEEETAALFLAAADGDSTSISFSDLSALTSKASQEWKETAGSCLGYISCFLYLISRVSQIVKNSKRKSAEGLASSMFLCAVCANLFYGSSVILRSRSREEMLSSLPWALGSLGTVALDGIILSQAGLFGASSSEKKSDGGGSGGGGDLEEALLLGGGGGEQGGEGQRSTALLLVPHGGGAAVASDDSF